MTRQPPRTEIQIQAALIDIVDAVRHIEMERAGLSSLPSLPKPASVYSKRLRDLARQAGNLGNFNLAKSILGKAGGLLATRRLTELEKLERIGDEARTRMNRLIANGGRPDGAAMAPPPAPVG